MKTIVLLSLLLLPFGTFAQSHLSGKVTDQNKVGLPGANVYIEGTYFGASTDTNGVFRFSFPDTGTFQIVVDFLGYEKYTQPVQLNGADIKLNMVLKEQFNELNAVTITAGTYGTGKALKAVVMTSLDVVTTAGSMGDINAAMRSLPGTTNNGESGKLFVHGGEGNETGTYIDGIYVHQPYTSSAPNMAVRGRFNPFMFSGTSFSTGGYSAEYGQALSSVLTLNTNDMPMEDELNFSIMSVGLDAAGTKKWKSGAITASANYMNLTPYMKLVPQNYDWNKEPEAFGGAVSFRQKTKGLGMLKVYASADNSNLSQNRASFAGAGNTQELDLSNTNAFVNANWHASLTHKWFVTLGGSFTHNVDAYRQETGNLDRKIAGYHAKATAKRTLSDKVNLRFGIENIFTDYSDHYSYGDVPGDSTVSYRENHPALFVEAQVYTSNKFMVNAGLRAEYSDYLREGNLSPRLSAGYKIGENSTLSAAYGWFYQNPLQTQLVNRSYLQNERADHYIMSFQHTESKRMFRAEAYYKQYSSLVKYGTAIADQFTNTGVGYAYGLDLYFKDDKTIKNGSYWISYSFLQTERDFRGYPEMAVPTFAAAHNLSVVYKHWINGWRSYVGASFNLASPRRYNDPNSSEFNTGKLPAYASLDLNWSFLYRQNIIFHAAVTNVLGFDQVFGYQYDPIPDQQGQFARTPVLPAAKRFFFVGCFITLSKKGEANQMDKIN